MTPNIKPTFRHLLLNSFCSPLSRLLLGWLPLFTHYLVWFMHQNYLVRFREKSLVSWCTALIVYQSGAPLCQGAFQSAARRCNLKNFLHILTKKQVSTETQNHGFEQVPFCSSLKYVMSRFVINPWTWAWTSKMKRRCMAPECWTGAVVKTRWFTPRWLTFSGIFPHNVVKDCCLLAVTVFTHAFLRFVMLLMFF